MHDQHTFFVMNIKKNLRLFSLATLLLLGLSCSKEQNNEQYDKNLEGTWGMVYAQMFYTYKDKIVIEDSSENFDPYNPIEGLLKYSILYLEDDTLLFTEYEWRSKKSEWTKWHTYKLKRTSTNKYVLIENDVEIDDEEIELTLSQSNSVLTMVLKMSNHLVVHYGNTQINVSDEPNISDYLNKGGILSDGILAKLTFNRMSPL